MDSYVIVANILWWLVLPNILYLIYKKIIEVKLRKKGLGVESVLNWKNYWIFYLLYSFILLLFGGGMSFFSAIFFNLIILSSIGIYNLWKKRNKK